MEFASYLNGLSDRRTNSASLDDDGDRSGIAT